MQIYLATRPIIFNLLIYLTFRSDSITLDSRKPLASSETILHSAFKRIKKDIFLENFIPDKFPLRNADFEPNLKGSRTFINIIAIEEHRRAGQKQIPHGVSSEAYTLHISADGSTTVRIVSPQGGLHALSVPYRSSFTLTQVVSITSTRHMPLWISRIALSSNTGV